MARVKLLAQEIEDADPDLIGLQEVAIWRRGQRGAADGATTPSEEVVYDYLELLQDELKRRGLNYKVASRPAGSRHRGADLDQRRRRRRVRREAHHAGRDPRQEGREDVERTERELHGALNVSRPGQPARSIVLRGYNAVNVNFEQSKKKKQKFQFVNTHLESFFAATRNRQATELVSETGPLSPSLPIILLGDLNSDPADPPPASTAYNRIVGDQYDPHGGFDDLGLEENTCCFSETLFDDPPATFTSRIDHVLGRGEVSEVSTRR